MLMLITIDVLELLVLVDRLLVLLEELELKGAPILGVAKLAGSERLILELDETSGTLGVSIFEDCRE